ncbi:MAG: hypothetical protein RW306_04060 [Geobacteraceae bacterium]|nr:hypothetical protein [Geobacteraceae bacterium]
MSEVTDDLDKLLGDVKKTIDDNRQFLKAFLDDTDDVECDVIEDTEKDTEAFEEL